MCSIRAYRAYENDYVGTYVTHENIMFSSKMLFHTTILYVRTYVTHENMLSCVRIYVTYENV